jgi:hypothetical protein
MTFVDWYVSLTSYDLYRRVSHWYVEVGRDDGWRNDAELPHRLTHVLDADEAKRFSDADEWKWHAGDDTERFESREWAIAAAIEFFESSAMVGDRLLLGRDLGLARRQVLAVKS